MLDIRQMDLRALARAYHDGLINFKQYRSARTELLERVTGDDTIMVKPPSGPRELDSMKAQIDAGMKKRRVYISILFGALLVLLVVLLFALWFVVG